VLLRDLCRNVPQLPQPKTGQRRPPTADVIFAMVFKVYTTFSGRRFMSDLHDAHAKGHISQVVHYNSISRHFEMPEITPILSDLIVQSSLPLRTVESDFGPDSTGFSTSRFIRWFDEKYGTERSGHDWVKVHIMTGVRTNIITAAEVHGRDANDSPIMPSLLATTARHFTVKEVPADKAYASVENVEAVAAVGATPFIAFKSNHTGAAGGLWEKAYHFFALHREDFLKHYHKRSNVESTFSMVKAKFRDHVRAKTDVAMTNEVLCKLIAHNICVLIQSQCELGIEPVFWGDEPKHEPADILPLVRPG
jgi:transposase